jgi:peptide-methionine (R)-S-oxide reductase
MRKRLFYFFILFSCSGIGACQHNTTILKNNLETMSEDFSQTSTDKEEWKKKLTPEQYAITCEGSTEPAFSGKYLNNHKNGTYSCIRCKNILFTSDTKFESGSGWPSFYEPEKTSSIKTKTDKSYGMIRIEVICNTCGAHLGHVFNDGPPPTILIRDNISLV